MAETRENPRNEYTVLPPHLRPRYESRSDFRLLRQSFHHGWAEAVPAERKDEWYGDMTDALLDRRWRHRSAALRAFLAADKRMVEKEAAVSRELISILASEIDLSAPLDPVAIVKELRRRLGSV